MPVTSPNILFIQVDQLAASFLSCYGNSVSKTPNISRLAETGQVFESAYCNFPLCAPSRFSMLTGKLASNIGAYDNGAEFPSAEPTIPHYLRAAGYQTCLVGKMHFVGADQLHGFEQRLTTDIYPADFGWTGDWTEVTQQHSNDMRSFTKAGVCIRNPQMEYDDEVAHRAVGKIYDLARGTDPRPFFLTVSFTHPHDPYQCSREHWNRYRPEDIDLPTVDGSDERTHDPYSLRLRQQYGLDQQLPSIDQIRTARHAYYGSISYIDDKIGEILNTLKHVGLDENLAVILTSDHGDMMGERGLWYKKSFFEQSVCVPLIFNIPDIPSRRITQAVSLVDLLPTLLELCSDNKDPLLVEELDGTSLCPALGGDGALPSSVVYAENLAEGAMSPILMVVKDAIKYVFSGTDPEQLYDLCNDELELNNVIADPNYKSQLKELRKLATAKWDVKDLSARVQISQRRRLFIAGVMGTDNHWEYYAQDQLRNHCLRADKRYNEWAYNDTI